MVLSAYGQVQYAESPSILYISTLGYTNVRFEFTHSQDQYNNNDFCNVEYSVNGGASWNLVSQVSNADSVPVAVNFINSILDNVAFLSIRVTNDVGGNINKPRTCFVCNPNIYGVLPTDPPTVAPTIAPSTISPTASPTTASPTTAPTASPTTA